jgi:hypothetical protein
MVLAAPGPLLTQPSPPPVLLRPNYAPQLGPDPASAGRLRPPQAWTGHGRPGRAPGRRGRAATPPPPRDGVGAFHTTTRHRRRGRAGRERHDVKAGDDEGLEQATSEPQCPRVGVSVLVSLACASAGTQTGDVHLLENKRAMCVLLPYPRRMRDLQPIHFPHSPDTSHFPLLALVRRQTTERSN